MKYKKKDLWVLQQGRESRKPEVQTKNALKHKRETETSDFIGPTWPGKKRKKKTR
jgi:hypothetical protein